MNAPPLVLGLSCGGEPKAGVCENEPKPPPVLPALNGDVAAVGEENADGFGEATEPPKIDPPDAAPALNGLPDVPNPCCV